MMKVPTRCTTCKASYDPSAFYAGSHRCKRCELEHKKRRRRSKGIGPRKIGGPYSRYNRKHARKAKPVNEWELACSKALNRCESRWNAANLNRWQRRINSASSLLGKRPKAKALIQNQSPKTWTQVAISSHKKLKRSNPWEAKVLNYISSRAKRRRVRERAMF